MKSKLPDYTKEYIEQRIMERKRLTKKEKEKLPINLKLYYNELEQTINDLKQTK